MEVDLCYVQALVRWCWTVGLWCRHCDWRWK